MIARRALPLCLALACGAALAAPSEARAQAVEAEARSTARKLGQEGIELFKAGDYSGALEKFNTADSLVSTPTLGLYAARCLVKLGRFVAASERYLDVTRAKLERNAPAIMRKAQIDAVTEREKLLPRIASLEIRVAGLEADATTKATDADAQSVAVTMDDKPVLPGVLGVKQQVDPGRHRLVATHGSAKVSEEVTLAEGEEKYVVLKLPPPPAPPPPPIGKTPLLRNVGYAAVGVGSASIVLGLVTGLMAAGEVGSLTNACPNHVCPNQAALAKTNGYDTERGLSTAGFVVGAIALAGGVPLVLLTPKKVYFNADGSPAAAPHVDATVSWRGASVRGVF